MNLYIKTVNNTMKAILYLEALLLFISVIVVSLQVFTRYVLNDPFTWTEQTGRYLFVWMMMLGLSAMFNSNITMAFDLILNKLTGKPHKFIALFFKLFTITFCGYWCYSGILYVMEHGSKIAPGINIPLACMYVAQPIGAVLIILVMIKQILEMFRGKGVN